MAAYYNEFDEYAAEWLRKLIAAGRIAPGDVDTRSIEDVKPDDLRGYTQCHFFAGIGVWSHALRSAGWPDDRPVWTGSCPCQPFSAAGKGGGFADERHLWPAFFHLIHERRPPVVYGEQVASKDGLAWLDLVCADLESAAYAVGAADLCAAGVGAPHIRQRIYWVADSAGFGLLEGRPGVAAQERDGASRNRALGRLGHNDDARLEGLGRGHQAESGRLGALRSAPPAGESGGLADADGRDAGPEGVQRSGEQRQQPQDGGGLRVAAPSPTNGYWRDADWLFCRDGRWRPVEPSTFPLAHGAPARVGRLRAYGNAIVAQVAEAWISAYLEAKLEVGGGVHGASEEL